jgi:hypothetical protein
MDGCENRKPRSFQSVRANEARAGNILEFGPEYRMSGPEASKINGSEQWFFGWGAFKKTGAGVWKPDASRAGI